MHWSFSAPATRIIEALCVMGIIEARGFGFPVVAGIPPARSPTAHTSCPPTAAALEALSSALAVSVQGCFAVLRLRAGSKQLKGGCDCGGLRGERS